MKHIGWACSGLYHAFKSEWNFKVHLIALIGAVVIGGYLGLSATEWGLVILSIGFVLAAELFNTALERLGDEVAGDEHKALIGKAKDISAAAVLISSVTALVIGIIILVIPLIQKLAGG